jgi:hypothetical protein
LTIVSGPFILTVYDNGDCLQGDASRIWIEHTKGAGLARYCQDGGKNRANVTFAQKTGCANTWGIKSVGEIDCGEEIFIVARRVYDQTTSVDILNQIPP